MKRMISLTFNITNIQHGHENVASAMDDHDYYAQDVEYNWYRPQYIVRMGALYSDYCLRLNLQTNNTTTTSIPPLQHRPTHRTSCRIPRHHRAACLTSRPSTSPSPTRSKHPRSPTPSSCPYRHRNVVRALYSRSDGGEEALAAADVTTGCECCVRGRGETDGAGVR